MEPLVLIDRGGTPRLAKSRINVYDVIPYLAHGHSANYIALVLRIRLVEAEALIRYVEEHKEEVMAVHWQIEERNAKGNPPEIEARLAQSPTHALLQAHLAEVLRKRAEENRGESDSW